MVENFYLKGRGQPTISRLLRDIKSGRIPGVVVVPEGKGAISICLGLMEQGQKHVPNGHFIHIYPKGVPGVFKGNPDKISAFSRFGSNYDAEEIVNRVAKHYHLGYSSGDDGIKRKVPKNNCKRRG